MITLFGECKQKREVVLFQSFFFLGNLRAEHQRKVYNIMDLISEIGGLYAALFTAIGCLGNYINI